MSSGSTTNNADGQRIFSGGLLDFGPVTTNHDDVTPALIPLEDVPFNQPDWPLPNFGRVKSLMVTISSRLANDFAIVFSQLDWPNPLIAKKSAPLTWTNNNQQNTLIPIQANPFVQTDWPDPQIKKSTLLTDLSILPPEPIKPLTRFDWVNPPPARKVALTHIFTPQLETAPTPPFIPVDYPNPLIGKRNAVRFEIARPQFYQDIQPFAQYDWKIPSPKLLKSETWIQNLLETTLFTAPVQPPSPSDFPTPLRKPGLIVTIASGIVEAPPSQPPFVNEVFLQTPRARKSSQVGWTQSRPLYYQDIKPFKQDNYPNPALRPKPPNTWIFSRKPDEPTAQNPFINSIYPNPISKGISALTWIFQAPFQQIFTRPIAFPFYDVPTLRIRPAGLTWINPRPQYYTEPVLLPFSPVLYTNTQRKPNAIPGIATRFQLVSIVGNPFRQNEWPNPQAKRRLPEQWEFYYQQDDNQPPVAIAINLPTTRRATVPLTWIQSAQLAQASQATPIPFVSFPNPIILKKQTNSWIVNLLQSTLTPAPGETPFAQYNWPNPLISRRILHSGWSQDRKQYYTEPSIQIAQYDWPIFRPAKRNQVGFIDFKIGTSEPPKFVNLTDTPPTRKVIITPSWIYNLLPNLIPVSALNPFSQRDWPIPLRRKINYDILSILGQDFIILPSIIGREICLLSSTTEYYLISSIEEYDLESSITEYNLDSGGDECQ